MRRHLDDGPGTLTTLLNMGCVFFEAGQPEDSLAFFREGHGLAAALSRSRDEGLAASYIGLAHKQLQKQEKAARWFAEAYRLLREQGSPDDVRNTLAQLAEIYEAAGNGGGMVTCYRELAAYCRARDDRPGELKAVLLLATTYFRGGMADEATQTFEEGLRLSRQLGDAKAESLCVSTIERLAGGGDATSGATREAAAGD